MQNDPKLRLGLRSKLGLGLEYKTYYTFYPRRLLEGKCIISLAIHPMLTLPDC